MKESNKTTMKMKMEEHEMGFQIDSEITEGRKDEIIKIKMEGVDVNESLIQDPQISLKMSLSNNTALKEEIKYQDDLEEDMDENCPPIKGDIQMVECSYGCGVILESEHDKAFHILWRHHETIEDSDGRTCYLCPECWTCFLKNKLSVTWQSIVFHLAYKCTELKAFYRCRICKDTLEHNTESNDKSGEDLELNIRQHMDIHKHSSASQYYLSFFPQEYDKCSLLYCDLCDFMTTNVRNLNRHMVYYHDGACFPCEQCNYKGTTKQNLKSHVEAQHEGIRYPCDQCQYKATLKANLKTHIASQHGGFLYCCEKCSYMTNNKYYLKNHMTVHKGFAKKDNIKVEEKLRRRIESQKKIITCTSCDYKTTKKGALNKHLKTHQ